MWSQAGNIALGLPAISVSLAGVITYVRNNGKGYDGFGDAPLLERPMFPLIGLWAVKVEHFTVACCVCVNVILFDSDRFRCGVGTRERVYALLRNCAVLLLAACRGIARSCRGS